MVFRPMREEPKTSMQKTIQWPAIILVFGFVALATACTSSSGVVRTGPETYMISRTEKGFKGSSGVVKAAALDEANRYCESRGKVMKLISTSQKDMVPFKSDASAEVHFKCLDPNDPELRSSKTTETTEEKRTDPKQADLYGELSKLDELRKKGLLTDAEFQEEKKKLLSRSK